jgi:LysR family transcriptional regulator, transcriptional activator of the cysJI operon
MRLRLLLEVDRLGSITRAAEVCSIGQPAASAHLRTLEAAVGRRLYERAGRATRLTDAGQLLARHAAIVLSTLDGLEEQLGALDGALTGTLRLSTCDAFGIYVLPAVLTTFALERPRVEIHVHIAPSGEVVREVARGEARLGIAGQTRRPAGVQADPLVRDDLVWIGRPSTVPRALSCAALRELTVIVPGPESSTRAMTERILRGMGCRPARMLELDSVEAVKRAVAAGLGVANVSRLAVADDLAGGELRELRLPGAPPVERLIELVREEHRRPTPLEQLFAHILRVHCMGLDSGARV